MRHGPSLPQGANSRLSCDTQVGLLPMNAALLLVLPLESARSVRGSLAELVILPVASAVRDSRSGDVEDRHASGVKAVRASGINGDNLPAVGEELVPYHLASDHGGYREPRQPAGDLL